RAMPPVERLAGTRPPPAWQRRGTWLNVLAGVLFFAGAPLFFVAVLPDRCGESDGDGVSLVMNGACLVPIPLALAAAVVVAAVASLVIGRMARRAIAGRSDSAARLGGIGCAAFIFVLEATFLLAAALL